MFALRSSFSACARTCANASWPSRTRLTSDRTSRWVTPQPADPDAADPGRVVLQLAGLRGVKGELVGDHDILIAAEGDAGLLADLVHPRPVGVADRGAEALE
jgi:hypothetical protein